VPANTGFHWLGGGWGGVNKKPVGGGLGGQQREGLGGRGKLCGKMSKKRGWLGKRGGFQGSPIPLGGGGGKHTQTGEGFNGVE